MSKKPSKKPKKKQNQKQSKKQVKKLNKKLIIAIALCVVVVLVAICLILFSWKKIVINDKDGNTIATAGELNIKKVRLKNSDYLSYVDVVIDEAKEILGEDYEPSGKMIINTNFDNDAFEACSTAYQSTEFAEDIPFAMSVVDINGAVLCSYSKGPKEDKEFVNYATEKGQAYSSFKPLSVYAPAIDNGTITCSTEYLDAPIKQVEDASGELVGWPSNGTGTYRETEVTIADGIKKSLNTTAVRALKDYGISNSLDFLSENFGIDLDWERRALEAEGEDGVLSSIGLGYLHTGVSPLDMSGFYEIFANEGKYEKPHSIKTIEVEGTKTYDYSEKELSVKQVISSETAYIMNRLLQGPLEEGGTAQSASTTDVPLGGKTGTGTDYLGNWMVGFTPEYVISVWHGSPKNNKNICAKTFGVFMENMTFDETKDFPINSNVITDEFMSLDGKKTGYYLPE